MSGKFSFNSIAGPSSPIRSSLFSLASSTWAGSSTVNISEKKNYYITYSIQIIKWSKLKANVNTDPSEASSPEYITNTFNCDEIELW